MTVTAYWYGNGLKSIAGGLVDFDTDTIKCALATSSYTPAQDTHDYFNDVTNEVSSTGTNYTAGGATLTNCTLTYTAGTNVLKFDAEDVTWLLSTITARYAIVYKSLSTAATSPLLLYVDFGEDIVSAYASFVLTWDSAGIATITAA